MISDILSVVVVAVTFGASIHLTRMVPEPYLDEVFHIPQAQAYCEGDYQKWDNKITTLPGLYLYSVGILKPLSAWLPGETCNVKMLRMISTGSYAMCVIIMSFILQKLHKNKDGFLNLSCVSLFPILWFFSLLYYTDVPATMFFLVMYYSHLSGSYSVAAFSGMLSVLCRQTNIIWVGFMCLLAAFDFLSKRFVIKEENAVKWLMGLLREVGSLACRRPKHMLCTIVELLDEISSYLLVIGLFCMFVWYNGSIAVGDKGAHQAVLHIPQVFYFAAFTAFFLHSYILDNVLGLLRFLWERKLTLVFLCVLGLGIVHVNTMAHPYLLADNRHYTFYIWRRVYMANEHAKYALVPLYAVAVLCIAFLMRHCEPGYKLAFWLCTALSVIPNKLLEFRYFVIPFLLVRFTLRNQSGKGQFGELVFCLVINTLTLYYFLEKPFRWPHDPKDLQRFMW